MRRLTPTCLLLSAFMAVPGSAALAHAVLIDSTPVPQGHVPAGALAIKFRYNSRIDAPRSKLTLVRADGSDTRLDSHGEGPDLLEASLSLAPGAYTLRWQVLAIDGHVTRGDVPFTVDAGAAAAAPAPPPSPSRSN